MTMKKFVLWDSKSDMYLCYSKNVECRWSIFITQALTFHSIKLEKLYVKHDAVRNQIFANPLSMLEAMIFSCWKTIVVFEVNGDGEVDAILGYPEVDSMSGCPLKEWL